MIDPTEVVQRIIAGRPDIATGTLKTRGTRETGYSNVSWTNSARIQNDAKWMADAELNHTQTVVTFQLYKVSEATDPKPLDEWTDTAGLVYEVKDVKRKMMGYIWDLLCLQQLT